MRERRLCGLLFAGATVFALLGCLDASAQPAPRPPTEPALTVLAPQGGGVPLVLSWVPRPLTPNRRPVVAFDTRIVNPVLGDTLAAGTVTQSPDTLVIPAPLAGDTVDVRGCVRAIDDRGGLSAWQCSGDYAFPTPYVVPLPPDSVGVDTVPGVTQVVILQPTWPLGVGVSQQWCAALILEDNTAVLGQPVFGWDSLEQRGYCEDEFAQWLAGRTL
jgi:hypothetical protein